MATTLPAGYTYSWSGKYGTERKLRIRRLVRYHDHARAFQISGMKSPVQTLALCHLAYANRRRENSFQLKNLNVQLLAISPDQPSKLKETIDKHNMGFRLLSDSDTAAARSFGVAYKLGDATLAERKKYNIDVEEASGQKHHLLPVPAVFLVATNGLIQFECVNPDYKVRLDPDLLLAAAKIMLGG